MKINNLQYFDKLKNVFGNNLTPLTIRKHPLFSQYFDSIWETLGDTFDETKK